MPIKLVVNDPLPYLKSRTIELTPADIAAYCSPGVYIFYDADRQPLYIGSGKCVMGRCMGIHHRSDIRAMATSLTIKICASHAQALSLEKQLIREMRPRFNGKRLGRNKLDIIVSEKTRDEQLSDVWK